MTDANMSMHNSHLRFTYKSINVAAVSATSIGATKLIEATFIASRLDEMQNGIENAIPHNLDR